MCARVLPWSTQSSNSSNPNSNSAISFALPAPASASSALASVHPSASASSPGSPPSPSVAFPAPLDSQASLSWPPPSSASASAGPSLLSPPPGQPSASTPISTTSSQGGGGSTGTTSSSSSSSVPLPVANGVVVVGVIGRVEREVSQFLDRLLDCHLFGALNRAPEQWQESGEQFVFASDLTGGITRERKQRKDGHRNRSSEVQEDAVLEGEGLSLNSGSTVTEDLGQKSGSRGGKGHVKNGHYGRRREEVEGGSRGEKRHGEPEDSKTRKDSQFEIRGGKGGDDDSENTREGWKEGQWSVPWLLSKFKYHHDVEKGTVYVQFIWGVPPLDCLTEGSLRTSVAKDGLFGTLEHHDADGMRGLLFMFSVCHVIMLVQEGAGFDPHVLRVFRLLQTAKHSLAPFVKTQILPGLLPPPSSAVRPSPLKPLSLGTRHTFGRSGVAGQNSSTVALMSGSTPLLIPGQCTPVVLFVYLEDVAEPIAVVPPQGKQRADGLPDKYLPNYLPRQSPFLNSFLKPASTGLAAPRTNKKSEPGSRKKLQASLEAQIRFLLKKCRTVTGFGDTVPLGSGVAPGMGPRGPGTSVNSFQGVGGGGALFVLDPSRAVILLDRTANHETEALDAATDAMEAMLSDGFGFGGFGINLPDKDGLGLENLLWDLGATAATAGEDLQAVKDFVCRQTEILRGKGGISGNTGSGGTGGVGMVAAAAAAAAASAASGSGGGTNKPISNPPELPTFSSWLSACRVLAEALSARLAEDAERDGSQKSSTHSSGPKKGAVSPTRTSGTIGKTVKTKPTIESSLQFLDTGSHVDLKFSAAWCERVLPSALDVYLKGLPPSYPTNLHSSQLEKALRRFHSMVRGQAVSLYAEKLKERCEALWHSGRQLCDAESLTGKPCIDQVHAVGGTVSNRTSDARGMKDGNKGASERLVSKPHSSGVVFLHACACGRSRKLRKDPFDFESANVTFSRFPSCEELLPSLVIPSLAENLPSGGSPWSLVRLGMSRYYQPEVGLIQSGFLPKQNFLSSWDIPLVYSTTEEPVEAPPVVSSSSSYKEDVAELVSSKPVMDPKMTNNRSVLRGTKQPGPPPKPAGGNPQGRVPEKGYSDSKTRATSASSDAKKGFIDSTSKVNYGGESAFPPLPEKAEKPLIAITRPARQQGGKDKKSRSSVVQEDENAVPSALPTTDVVKISQQPKLGGPVDPEEAEQISNVRQVSGSGSELNPDSVTRHVRLYIGFEHECPHGHRFLLSDNQPERLSAPSSSVKSGAGASPKLKKHDRMEQQRMRDSSSLAGSQQVDATLQETLGSSAGNPLQTFPPKWTQKGAKIPDKMQYWSVQDGHGDGLSLLSSNLPLFMHCPYCKTSSGEDSNPNKRVTFGGTISQLQRVFLVTPSSPLQLGSSPVVEFEDVSKPSKTILKFTPGSEIVLPPDSFLSLRLPFVYYSQVEGDAHRPLLVNQNQPERCAWLVKNTALYVMSKGGMIEQTISGPSG